MTTVTLTLDGGEYLPGTLAALQSVDALAESHAHRNDDGSIELSVTFTKEIHQHELIEAGIWPNEMACSR